MTDALMISQTKIGDGAPPYLIAEIGINHGGDVGLAARMIKEARAAGAQAAKLQAFRTAALVARTSPYFQVLDDAALSKSALAQLVGVARDAGVAMFASVFDEDSADTMADLDAPAFKIASGDINHLPLLRHVAAFGRPMIISTGGATMGDIERALSAVSQGGAAPVALLHCVSHYPTPAAQANLACLPTIKAQFGVPVGFSDHTMGEAVALAAAALGADIIEKHFTFDRDAPGPDHALSSDPAGLTRLAEGLQTVWQAVGHSQKMPVETTDHVTQIRRCVTADVAIPAGTEVRADMLAVKRPGTGLAPDARDLVVGRRARQDIPAETAIDWSMID